MHEIGTQMPSLGRKAVKHFVSPVRPREVKGYSLNTVTGHRRHLPEEIIRIEDTKGDRLTTASLDRHTHYARDQQAKDIPTLAIFDDHLVSTIVRRRRGMSDHPQRALEKAGQEGRAGQDPPHAHAASLLVPSRRAKDADPLPQTDLRRRRACALLTTGPSRKAPPLGHSTGSATYGVE